MNCGAYGHWARDFSETKKQGGRGSHSGLNSGVIWIEVDAVGKGKIVTTILTSLDDCLAIIDWWIVDFNLQERMMHNCRNLESLLNIGAVPVGVRIIILPTGKS